MEMAQAAALSSCLALETARLEESPRKDNEEDSLPQALWNNCHNKSVAELRQPFPTQDPESSDLHMLHRKKENVESLVWRLQSSRSELLETTRLEGFVFREALQQFKDPRPEETASPPVFPEFLRKSALRGKMVGMEAAAVSAVISGTLKILGNKLAPWLIKEYSSIVGVKDDLQELSDLVEEINTWLETAGYKALENNPSSSTWLKKLKDVAHAVDDVVDEFHLEAEKHDVCGGGGSVTKYMCTKPKSLILQCKAARKLKAIKKIFAAVVKQRSDFHAIAPGLPVDQTKKTTVDAPTLPIVDEASVLGRDQEKNQIVSKLVEADDQKNIKIVSITGLGGSGKTTLAKLVYSDVNKKKHFDVQLWVHVSQELDVGNLIKKLFESFADGNPGHDLLPYMSKRIEENLTGKRFLLVLDDVWTNFPIMWEELKGYLKGGIPGSRILLTTRDSEVAKKMGSTATDQFPLPYLSENDSWELFQQSLIMDAKGLEPAFINVGKEIVKKCGGVPLAVKVLAGSLHGKERIEEWEAMRDENLLYVGDQEHRISACLRLSYFHLPSFLKPCFTICSVFPKGHKIDKEELIDLWIAHDMITLGAGVNSLEYSGLKCFNSLVQMSFLQDLDKAYGRVRCRMHDLVHDFAQKVLGDEISHAVPQEAASSTNSYRYFCLRNQSRNLMPKNTFEKARAIYVQDSNITFGKSLKNARHLRSIHVHYGNTTTLNTILQIRNLRYLCMPELRCQTLPEAISDIWGLQALHIPSSGLLELPKSIGRLQRLRTLNLSFCTRLKGLPDSIGDCHMISTMDLCGCWELTTLPNSMERNKNLRVLKLRHTKIQRLPPAIVTLEHLECLDLKGCMELVELPDGFGNLKKLELLNLKNCYEFGSMPVGLGQLSRLRNLKFFVVGESEKSEPISGLGNIAGVSRKLVITNIAHVLEPDDTRNACLKQKTNLQSLKLLWQRRSRMIDWANNVENEKAIPILDGLEPPTAIKVLEIEGYTGVRFAQWMLNKVGVEVQESPRFPCLTKMVLSGFPSLRSLEGLVELPCLEDLKLEWMPFVESISGGPFPSLANLEMIGMYSLGEVWMVSEKTTLTAAANPRRMGQFQIGSHLSYLSISSCPYLKIKPHVPLSLEKLSLNSCNEQLLFSPGQGSSLFSDDADFSFGFAFSRLKELSLCFITGTSHRSEFERWWEFLQYMTALESLDIEHCSRLTELPESMRSLTSLRILHIGYCCALCKLPAWLGEVQSLQEIVIDGCGSLSSLSPSMLHLTALQTLRISSNPLLQIESLRSLTSPQELVIRYCEAIHQLPEWLVLRIFFCPGIKSLPEGIQGLTALEQLWIYGCPDLERRYPPPPQESQLHPSCYGMPLPRSGCMWAASRSQDDEP
ncbi:hypothetical protein ACP70R_021624 [Stipagrostis hirtigluma subsp. patula]